MKRIFLSVVAGLAMLTASAANAANPSTAKGKGSGATTSNNQKPMDARNTAPGTYFQPTAQPGTSGSSTENMKSRNESATNSGQTQGSSQK